MTFHNPLHHSTQSLCLVSLFYILTLALQHKTYGRKSWEPDRGGSWNQEVIQWLKVFLLSEGSGWISALWLLSLFQILSGFETASWNLDVILSRRAFCWDLCCCGGDPAGASVCIHLLFSPQFPGPPCLSPFYEGWHSQRVCVFLRNRSECAGLNTKGLIRLSIFFFSIWHQTDKPQPPPPFYSEQQHLHILFSSISKRDYIDYRNISKHCMLGAYLSHIQVMTRR